MCYQFVNSILEYLNTWISGFHRIYNFCKFFNWFIFPAESPVHNNTRNSTLYLQPRADARYSHNNRPFSTTIHHRCLCLSCVSECEYFLSIVHYCCESCEWRGSVLGRHLGSGKMSSGFIYTGCGTYTCGNWTMRKTMRTIMSMWQQDTQNQHKTPTTWY